MYEIDPKINAWNTKHGPTSAKQNLSRDHSCISGASVIGALN